MLIYYAGVSMGNYYNVNIAPVFRNKTNEYYTFAHLKTNNTE